MAEYLLTRDYWDGEVLYRKGTKKEFVEGTQPSTAKLVEKPSAKRKATDE